MDADLCDRVAVLEALVAELVAAARPPLAERLLVAIHAVVGGEPFVAGDLVELARVPLSGRRALRDTVVEVVRDLHAPGAGRRLGRFLAANSHVAAGDLVLVPVKRGRDGGVWRASVAAETRGRWNALIPS